MDKTIFIQSAAAFVRNAEDNKVQLKDAIDPELVGLRLYEEPIFAFGDASDPYFEHLKDPAAVGPHFIPPMEWLPQAKTVISFFLPLTQSVRKSNRQAKPWPSPEWLYSRIEGQAFIDRFSRHLKTLLDDADFSTIIPTQDERFWSTGIKKRGIAQRDGENTLPVYTSNWSERHVAFVCGLGTFGLSKGLITRKGIAGRFGSLITDWVAPFDQRDYTDTYEYCNYCGACIRQCPVHAISLQSGKDHALCKAFLDKTLEQFQPRYACGKCQVGVPCENGIPSRLR